jgi:hypothetical protein
VDNRAGECELAASIASLDEVERCIVSRWSRRITVILSLRGAHSVQATLGSLELIIEGRSCVGPGRYPDHSA